MGDSGEAPRVSVVVNAYNEAERIGSFLDCLVAQTFGDFDVVLVDDGSTDGTAGVAEAYASRLNLRVVPRPHLGLKAARAAGLAESRGEVCLTLDVDQVLPEDCVARFVDAFGDPGVGAVSARRVSLGEGWIVNSQRLVSEAAWRIRRNAKGDLRWATGGACAYRKSALEEVGGLTTEAFTAADLDISWRLREAGWKIVARDDIVIWHRDPGTLSELWRRSELQGGNMLGTYLAHPRQLADWRFGTRFYPAVIGVVLVVRPALGVFAAATTFAWLHYQLRDVSNSRKDRSLAWLVFTAQNVAWSVGLLRALVRRAMRVLRGQAAEAHSQAGSEPASYDG